MESRFRQLPSVDKLLSQSEVVAAIAEHSRPLAVEAARQVLDEARQTIAAGGQVPGVDDLARAVAERVAEMASLSLRPVVNATGVIINTNLGRAPLSDEAVRAMAEVSRQYSNLEYDLESGERGSRHVHVERLLCRLTGAEAGLVVNNNASAVLLALSALAAGREVVIARSQVVEIGGGFRVPDVMRQSGAVLVEVGTTNRTYRRDYEERIGPNTALLMRVHPSNFRVVGFTCEVQLPELVELGAQYRLPVLDDLGSGALLDTSAFGMAHEPTPQESVRGGAGLVCFSGDKLLGGPQAGIIVGRKDLVEHLRRHPLARAVRIDKLTLAGLQVTLNHYLRGEALEKVPVWKMISAPLSELERRAAAWAGALAGTKLVTEVVDSQSTVGGGSLPGE
ncbi:MAG: L-seryl-tRNA(Sec) selenium transferase, partial [Chloroflexota bacterium]